MSNGATQAAATRFLPGSASEQIGRIGEAEIVVGIPSFNNVKTITQVAHAAQVGLAKYFPGVRALLINSDGGSTDGTQETFMNSSTGSGGSILLSHTATPTPLLSFPYHGVAGKGSAFAAIFTAASIVGARACAVLDSDLRSVTPEWIELLLKPVMEDRFDFVSPLYHRHKYDGTITNSIIYPLTRALYGRRVRQPIGGDFGFSGRLAGVYMAKEVWETDVARFGVDIWMTTTALANGFRVCQSFLGAKIHDQKDPSSSLGGMMQQVVGSAFGLMEENYPVWKNIRGSQQAPTFGFLYTPGYEPVNVNVKGMLDKFRLGVKELAEVWSAALDQDQLEALRAAAAGDDAGFCIPDQVWTRIIYKFALAGKRKALGGDHLIRSLVPLYLGRTASWVIETREMDHAQTEERLERLCLEYEAQKPWLAGEWEKQS